MFILELLKIILQLLIHCFGHFLNLLVEELHSNGLLVAMEEADGALNETVIRKRLIDNSGGNATRRSDLILVQVKIAEDGSPAEFQSIVQQYLAKRTLAYSALACD